MSIQDFKIYFSIQKLHWLFYFLFSQNCFGQNLVPNGNFETYSSLTIGCGEVYKAVGWDNVNGSIGVMPPYASPEYYYSLGPNCGWGLIPTPISGNGQAGFNTFQDSNMLYGHDFREYISCNLSTALIPNKKYKVSFSLTFLHIFIE